MSDPLDLVVVGAGPAGTATALFAARAGLSVALLEPRVGPVDKACGEGLMPGALAAVRELAGEVAGVDIAGIAYLDGAGRVARAPFRAGPGRGVRRTTLHAALLQAVQAAGIQMHAHRADGLTQDDEGVRVGGLRARYAVAADGLHSPVREELGLNRPVRGGGPARFGLRQHFQVAPWTDLVEVHWSSRAEAYVTPVGPAEVGIAVLTSHRLPYAEQLAWFPALRERLDGAEPITTVRGAGPLRQVASSPMAGRVLLVGDAAGYVDALTGEGIAVSFAAARAAVSCLVAGRPDDYARAWRAASRRYRWITGTLLAASRRPVLRSAIVPAARALPPVFRSAVNQLAR
ncbi:NAD(P)/FAD-dependent oxidoreductase [Angustibacter sp. McL0619]|uniref:NAD(P)/FAD-dependent oxidoreductase n=1 Tax=Angustibacter sp. McL0619 TaxID=3415676 RepID=UPI003CF649A6